MSRDEEDLVIDPVPVEARPYQGRRAGIVSRILACSIDFAVVLVVLASAYIGWAALLFLVNPTGFTFPSVTLLMGLIVGGAFLFVYLTMLWTTTGKTYGDHVLGLRVVNFRGDRVHFIGGVLRAAFCVFFPIGLFWCVVSSENRSVQDVVLRTSVIYDWKPRKPRGGSSS